MFLSGEGREEEEGKEEEERGEGKRGEIEIEKEV